MKMRINITKEDIENGRPVNCRACPIALAAKRATNQEWVVGFTHLWREVDGRVFDAHKLSPEARSFMDTFDRTGNAEPTAFDVDLAPTFAKL